MNGDQELSVYGNSMFPRVKEGDRLYFIISEKARIGDICLVRDKFSKTLITHRLIANNPLSFKGDNSLNIEQGPEFELLGVCLHKRKPINRLIAWLSSFYSDDKPKIIQVFSKILLRTIPL